MTAAAGAHPAPAVDRRKRPTGERCSQWIGAERLYCWAADGLTRYQPGYRCPAHDVRRAAGLADLPPSPGIPAYRTETES